MSGAAPPQRSHPHRGSRSSGPSNTGGSHCGSSLLEHAFPRRISQWRKFVAARLASANHFAAVARKPRCGIPTPPPYAQKCMNTSCGSLSSK
jgi:hypothetical protein